MTGRQQRTLRGSAASSIATVLAAVSHMLGGGAAPAPLLVSGMAVFLVPLAMALVGPRPRLLRLSGTALTAQVLFHIAFAALGSPTGIGVAGGHHHGHGAPISLGPVAVHASGLLDPPMLFAHATAAFVTIVLLWRGESVIRRIAGWAGTLLAHLRFAVVLPDLPPAPVAAARTYPVDTPSTRAPEAPRGPPRLSVA